MKKALDDLRTRAQIEASKVLEESKIRADNEAQRAADKVLNPKFDLNLGDIEIPEDLQIPIAGALLAGGVAIAAAGMERQDVFGGQDGIDWNDKTTPYGLRDQDNNMGTSSFAQKSTSFAPKAQTSFPSPGGFTDNNTVNEGAFSPKGFGGSGGMKSNLEAKSGPMRSFANTDGMQSSGIGMLTKGSESSNSFG
jgi:hypothetical protein